MRGGTSWAAEGRGMSRDRRAGQDVAWEGWPSRDPSMCYGGTNQPLLLSAGSLRGRAEGRVGKGQKRLLVGVHGLCEHSFLRNLRGKGDFEGVVR